MLLRSSAAACVLLVASSVAADAVVVTRAMKASTIMEVFVEPTHIDVELEIGKNDEAVLTPRGGELVLEADGRRLRGDVVETAKRKRVERDEITGEPQATPGADDVTFMKVRYSLASKPKRLVLRPPTRKGYAVTDIGFVAYHRGIAVNDFRYLADQVTLGLDWNDPFYTAFERRTFRRQHYAPMNVFVYVEPFEVRKEYVLRPVDLARFMDLNLDLDRELKPKEREALLEQIADFLIDRAPVTIDGQAPQPILDRIHFLKRGLRMTRVVMPDEMIPVRSAMIGAIYVYPVDGLPQEVTLRWDLFDERVDRVPAAATDEAGPMPSFLTPDDAELRWVNYLKNPTQARELHVRAPGSQIVVPLVWLAAIAITVVLMVVAYRQRSAALVLLSLLVLAGGWVLRDVNTVEVTLPPVIRAPSGEEASPTIQALLYNIYRAIDFRDEEVVFDRLANSLSGEVLERVYLEMRRGLQLQNQGGARVRVRSVEMIDAELDESVDGGLQYRCVWNATGSVGHWGHTHLRTNQYRALLTLAELGDRWKIADIDILEEQRLNP